ncbi:MAG TPA: hypothetical protein VFT82_03005 [Candidatus Paceibacterota bacterium]|nr:hypothetical protein [Candidatus Paceibacterota bacterium]
MNNKILNCPGGALSCHAVQNLFKVVIDPVVQLIFAAAVFYFLWGVFNYIRKADDPEERLNGRNHVIYSTIGLFVMISVWGIILLIKNTLGV